MASMRPRLIFLVGGPDFHPVNEQTGMIVDWLGPDYHCHTAENLAAFEHLEECDLLVLMGMHWTGLEGQYRSPTEKHRRAFEKYVASGRPILSAHGGVASYNDWPGFARLVGFRRDWDAAGPAAITEHRVRILDTGHPLVDGLSDFTIVDQLCADLLVAEDLETQVHAECEDHGRLVPMIISAEGGRIAGAGKTVHISNGHDMRSFRSPAMRTIWLNAVTWCLSDV